MKYERKCKEEKMVAVRRNCGEKKILAEEGGRVFFDSPGS